MNILIIEDLHYKVNELTKYLKSIIPDCNITVRESYNSGLKEIILNYSSYNLILLDMSMRNYDTSETEAGGDPIPLAGKLILNQMFIREIPTKVIVVTMYENFVDGTSLSNLDFTFKYEFKDNYLGYVYFSSSETKWKDDLKDLISNFDNNA